MALGAQTQPSMSFGVAFDNNVVFLSCSPEEVEGRLYPQLDCTSTGPPGHGSFTFLWTRRWRLVAGRVDPGWPSSFAHGIWPSAPRSQSHVLGLERLSLLIFAKEKGLWGEHCFDIYGSHQLLGSSHQRERERKCRCGQYYLVGSGMGFYSVRLILRISYGGSAVLLMATRTSSGNAPFLLC